MTDIDSILNRIEIVAYDGCNMSIKEFIERNGWWVRRAIYKRLKELNDLEVAILEGTDKILVDGMFYNPKKVLSIFSDEVRVYILNEEGESETSPINENGSFSYEYADSTRVNGSFSVLWYLITLIADYNSELRRVFLRKQEMASIYDYKERR